MIPLNYFVPYYINEQQSNVRGIKCGWYTLDECGRLGSGPFSSPDECRNSPCANVHVVALTSSPFDRVARNQGLLSGLRPVETTTYRKANPESGRLLGVPLR